MNNKQTADSTNGQDSSTRRVKIIGGVVLAVAALILFVKISGDDDGGSSAMPTTRVQRGPLTINLIESGTLKPRKQIVVKNELNDPATILYIVPEGKLVEEGELLVELDVTQLENDVIERRIRVQNDESDLVHAQENMKVVENQSEADLEQAKLTLQFAKEDLIKYQEGEYLQQLKKADAEITLAREELSQAQEDLKWSKILFEEKYLSQSDLQQDELAEQKAALNLELAQADLALLKTYTHPRQVTQLESDVRQAELAMEREKRMAAANLAQATAVLAARQAELKEEKDRLERYEKLLPNAKKYAPIAGMVLYATSVTDRWRRDDEPIEVGKVIRERDEIIYLPTASEFNVEIKVTEVDLGKIDIGMPVNITVDSMPESGFTGKVTSISQLPDADSRYLNPNLKLYATVIELDDDTPRLRNGMSCRAEITIEEYEDVVYVPIQTVTRLNGLPTVYVKAGDGSIIPRAVSIGFDNSRFIHIRDGLAEGEQILLMPPLSGREEKSDGASVTPESGEVEGETQGT